MTGVHFDGWVMLVDRWALITGASGGLGEVLARQLGTRGMKLILTARSADKLAMVAASIEATSGVEVRIYPVDLSQAGAVDALDRWLGEKGIEPDVLVNNAGFGLHGAFVDQDLDRLRAMIHLDVVALTELTHLHAGRMRARGHGRILLVGSMAAFQPVALYSAYAAAKAYVLALGEALHVELAPTVTVTVLSPGLMNTGFNDAAGYKTPASLKRMEMLPADVARIGLDALFAGKSGVIAGRLNKVMALASRVMPRHFSAKSQFDMAVRQAARG